MNPSRLLLAVACALAFWLPAAGAGAVGATAHTAPAARRPNILLMLADDLGIGDPRCYNPESRCETPAMDALARAGRRFTDAHSPSAVCTPTRYGLLTGRYAWRTRLQQGVLQGYDPALIEGGRLTLPELLRRQGYRTGGFGKWHLGFGRRARVDYARPLRPGPLEIGFDRFFGIPSSLDFPPYVFVDQDRPTRQPTEQIGDSRGQRDGGAGFWRAGAIAPGFRHADVLPEVTRQAIAFLQEQSAAQPFFCYLPFASPHTPWLPSAAWQGKSPAGPYGDFVMETDAAIGQVLAVLRERGLDRNTLVLLTSDNGAHWLPNEIERTGHRANGPWRGQKSDIFEAGHRVPFIARWPGVIPPGTTSDATLCHVDFTATIAELLGVPLPDDAAEDSFSFLSRLQDRASEAPARRSLVSHSGNGVFAYREGRWKLIEGLGSGGFTPPARVQPGPDGVTGQLYDLRTDPGETRNRWAERPEIVARLAARLKVIREGGRSRPRAAP